MLNEFSCKRTLDYVVQRVVDYDYEEISQQKNYAQIPVFTSEINPVVKTEKVNEHICELEDNEVEQQKVYVLRPALCISLVHLTKILLLKHQVLEGIFSMISRPTLISLGPPMKSALTMAILLWRLTFKMLPSNPRKGP